MTSDRHHVSLIHEKKPGRRDQGHSGLVLSYEFFKCRELIPDLVARIHSFSLSDRFFEEYELALYEFFEPRGTDTEDDVKEDVFRSEDEFTLFLSWYSFYFITDEFGRNFPDFYLQSQGRQASSLEEEILEGMAQSFLSVYEVQSSEAGAGLDLKDIFTEETCIIFDESLSVQLCKWDLLYAGIIKAGGFHFLGGFHPLIMPPRLKTPIEMTVRDLFLEERKNYSNMRDFLRRSSSEVNAAIEDAIISYERPAQKNSDGELLNFFTLVYHVNDPEQVRAALDRSSIMHLDLLHTDEEGGFRRADYIWIRKGRGRRKGMGIRGILFLERNTLKAKCNSFERSEKLRAVLDRMLSGMIEMKMAVNEKPEEGLQSPLCPNPPGKKWLYSIPECRDILKEIVDCHYRNWVNERLPAIGNMTPREAMKLPQGRKQLEDLLKELENENERAVRRGMKNAEILAFPVEMIRKDLGFP
ncbi:MAG TPA: hypothetical protein PK587_00185 [Syntrophales bacterium]|nr:hypothetical protein [Syntrophales bacterium]